MSLDLRRLSESLSTYAEGVGVTASDINEKQRALQTRVEQARSPRRRLVLTAAAALLVLLAAAAAGTVWLRHPETTVPASPQGVGSMTGLWRYQDTVGTGLFVVRRDGGLTEYGSARTLLRGGVGGPQRRLTNDGQQIIVDSTDAQGRLCRRTQSILAQSKGHLALGAPTDAGPVCLDPGGGEATMTRVSPDPGDVPPATEGPRTAVTDPVQLDGLWLLQGTSIVLAVDELGGPGVYLIDHDGVLEPAPDSHGDLSVGPDGVIVLASAGCPDTTLRRAEVQGTQLGETLTAVADADVCNQFGGQTTQSWVRVL